MTNIKGYLIERDNRTLFVRDHAEAQWALDDEEYKVTPLISGEIYNKIYDTILTDDLSPAVKDEQQERLEILEELYVLEEEQIASMKQKLEEAVELVENIHLFASNQATNIMEARGLLRLIAESCVTWLKPKE